MRSRATDDFFSVHAIAGTHVVVLGLDVKGYDDRSTLGATDSTEELAGAISRIALGEVSDEGRKTMPTSDAKGAPSEVIFAGFAIDRIEAGGHVVPLNRDGKPIQKLLWCDNTALPGRK